MLTLRLSPWTAMNILQSQDAYSEAVAMGSNDDMLARLDSRSNGLSPQGHEAVHCGLKGLCQWHVLRLVVCVASVISWEPWVILASFQFCM